MRDTETHICVEGRSYMKKSRKPKKAKLLKGKMTLKGFIIYDREGPFPSPAWNWIYGQRLFMN